MTVSWTSVLENSMYINNKKDIIFILLLFAASEILSCRSMSCYDEVEEGGILADHSASASFLAISFRGQGDLWELIKLNNIIFSLEHKIFRCECFYDSLNILSLFGPLVNT